MNLAPSDEQNSAGAEETIVRPRDQSPSGINRVDRLMTQRAYLEVTAGALQGQRFYLAPRDHLIGRSQEADIPLADESISRLHAKVQYRNDEFILVDLGSKNGTFLNGTNVHECPLRAGDEIMIGNHSLQFLFEAVRAPSL